jgi:hypothetical protein
MAQVLDMNQFTFNGEVIMAVSEMVFDEVIQAPEISLIHTVFPGIVAVKEVGFIGEGGLVGVANQGCDPEPQDWAIATRKLKWEPEEWEVLIHMCYKDLANTAAQYSLRNKMPYSDFSTSDYANIVVEVLATAMKKFIIRLAWFNDKDAATAGILSTGIDPAYFNIINGFWKQIIAQYTVNSAQRVVITENAGATYAAQALNPDKVRDEYLPGLIYGANMLLRGQSGGFVACTQSFYDGYSKSLKGIQLESMLVNLTDGIRTLQYDGKPLIAIPVWDEMIKEYENTGTKLNNPHRAVYTTKEVLGIGVNNANEFENLEIWYDRDSRKVKVEGMGMSDAKLTNPALFQVAI